MKIKEYKNEKEALHWLMSETWEVTNKPHRFFTTLKEIVNQFHDDKKYDYYLGKNSKKLMLLSVDLIQAKFYGEPFNAIKKEITKLDLDE